MQAGYAAIDCMRRPSRQNLDKLRARVAAIKKVQRESPVQSEPFNLAQAVAESWKQREHLPPDPPDVEEQRQSLILDTGYSGKNLVTAETAKAAKLPLTGPANTTIIDAHGNVSRADSAIQVNHSGAPLSAGAGIISSKARYSLAGGTNFADHGLIMIFHPGFGGVTMHRPEDIDIVYKTAPRVQGWRARTGQKMWHIPLEPPHPPKPSPVEKLLLSHSPRVPKENLAALHEVAHNVYELPTLGDGIKWMHAVCGYPAKDT